jgi:hypothetical protein
MKKWLLESGSECKSPNFILDGICKLVPRFEKNAPMWSGIMIENNENSAE